MSTMQARIPRHASRILELAETDPQLQELMPDPAVLEAVCRPGLLYEQVIDAALSGYGDRPALGERDVEVVVDPDTGRNVRGLLPSFSTISYQELHRRVLALAEVWRRHEVHRVSEGDFVCLLGFSGTDYVTVDLALAYARAVIVPLQTTLAGADLDGILTDTEPVALAATVSDLVVAARYAGTHRSIRSVIVLDHDDRFDDDRGALAAAQGEIDHNGSNAQIITLRDLVALGRPADWEPLPARADTAERLAMLVHSSGSTGTPKGAMFPDRLAGVLFAMVPPTPVPIVRLCFAPMNHQMGRGQMVTTLARGGTNYFTARADMSTLFEDFRLVRPTEVTMFPRVLEMVHRHHLSEVARRTAAGVEPERAKAEVTAEMRAGYLGDRVVLILVTSAPLTSEVRTFIGDCFDVTFLENYGSTEANGSVTVRDKVQRPPVIDYRLRDVPELGYFVTDKPYPRGELVVKMVNAVPGYYKKPDATANLFDDGGYLRTGDIMEERGPDHLVFIDRRNDVLKLAQGEFVTCGALGTTFESGSDVILQIYVYGNAARSYLVAVVVPHDEAVVEHLGDSYSPEALRSLIRAELKRVGQAEGLRSFEIPRDFLVEHEPFSHENGLLSSVHKRMRPNLQRRYGEALEQLYTRLERKQNDDLVALRDATSQLPVIDKVGAVLAATLGIEDVDTSQPFGFAELGGDSLGAAAFSALLGDVFDVELAVSAILSPTGNVATWSRSIERALAERGGGAVRPTFSSVHGNGTRRLAASDLTLDRFLEPGVLAAAATDEPTSASANVLLTGATGFLGRFLCLEWLERVSARGGTLSCLVRARDEQSALERLRAGLRGDADLEQRFDELARHHLRIVVGDVAEPRLGLDDATYVRLAHEIDRIVHPAALVNHVLDYEHLFGPNVAGTADLIGLALTGRQKRYDFVSSTVMSSFVDRRERFDETSPLVEEVELNDAYSVGYGASKWADEVLLHRAHEQFGLPVNIMRGDMMLPHSRYHGQINAPDVFVRMLFSLITTGLAPASFYEPGPNGERVRAHYDGLPVDFVAGAVAGIGEQAHRSIETFNMINHHVDDGVSLDSIVDWIESAGYPMERIEPHARWFEEFSLRLASMPERQRQHSSVQVLDPWRPVFRARPTVAGSDRFVAAVRRAPVGPEVPHLDEGYIHKCLDDLVRHGLIDAPARA